jgi:hypothetical protein
MALCHRHHTHRASASCPYTSTPPHAQSECLMPLHLHPTTTRTERVPHAPTPPPHDPTHRVIARLEQCYKDKARDQGVTYTGEEIAKNPVYVRQVLNTDKVRRASVCARLWV